MAMMMALMPRAMLLMMLPIVIDVVFELGLVGDIDWFALRV